MRPTPISLFPALVLAFCLSSELGCAAADETPLVIAHRGLASVYPANSVDALLAASDSGADAVETDLQLGDDGELMLAHDPDPACQDHPPEPFAPFLEQEDGRYRKLFLEIKGTAQNRAALTDRLIEVVDEAGVSDRTVVTSFHLDALLDAQQIASDRGLEDIEFGLKLFFDFGTDIEAGCTPTAPAGSEADAYRHGFDWVLWPATFIDHIDVKTAQSRGLRVATWSGETPSLHEKSISLDVDGIYTDAPTATRALVGSN